MLGSAFLLFAGGINGLILPLRGAYEGFGAFSLGLLGTGYAIGYVSGCIRLLWRMRTTMPTRIPTSRLRAGC